MFDLGGSTCHLRACPFLGRWRALLYGEVFVWAPDGTGGWSVFWQKDDRDGDNERLVRSRKERFSKTFPYR